MYSLSLRCLSVWRFVCVIRRIFFFFLNSAKKKTANCAVQCSGHKQFSDVWALWNHFSMRSQRSMLPILHQLRKCWFTHILLLFLSLFARLFYLLFRIFRSEGKRLAKKSVDKVTGGMRSIYTQQHISLMCSQKNINSSNDDEDVKKSDTEGDAFAKNRLECTDRIEFPDFLLFVLVSMVCFYFGSIWSEQAWDKVNEEKRMKISFVTVMAQ